MTKTNFNDKNGEPIHVGELVKHTDKTKAEHGKMVRELRNYNQAINELDLTNHESRISFCQYMIGSQISIQSLITEIEEE